MEVFNRWQKRLDIPIYQVYGSTEVGHVCYSRIGEAPKLGTIGLPLNSRECVIVDPATLEQVPPGESGELLVASPYTLKGYGKCGMKSDGACPKRSANQNPQRIRFDKAHLRRILDILDDKPPVALVCIGKPAGPLKPVPRKAIEEKTVFPE